VTESIKQTADAFSQARSVYKRRKSLRDKADKILADAPARVKAIVEGLEAEEAVEPALVPSSPDAC
jgi:vacuolar-type H+-ATPase subunit H